MANSPKEPLELFEEGFKEAIGVMHDAVTGGKIDGQIFKSAAILLQSYIKFKAIHEQGRQFQYSVLRDYADNKEELRRLVRESKMIPKLPAAYYTEEENRVRLHESGLTDEDIKKYRLTAVKPSPKAPSNSNT